MDSTTEAAQIASDQIFASNVEILASRHPRLITELLAEIAAERSLMTVIEEKVGRYLSISSAGLAVVAAVSEVRDVA